MRKLLTEINIGQRFRRELGDLTSLAASMGKRGLINPVTIDAGGNLIAGHRRIEAAKLLGWPDIDVRVIDTLGDAVRSIELERDENTCRKPMTGGELADLAARLADLARPAAAANQGGAGRDRFTSAGETVRVDHAVAPALGVGKSTAMDLIQIGRAARSEDPAEREAGQRATAALDAGRGVQPVATALREELGKTRASTPPTADREAAKAARQQAKLWANLAEQARGLAYAIPHLSAQGAPENESEAADYARDLRKLREVISQTIKILEGKVTR